MPAGALADAPPPVLFVVDGTWTQAEKTLRASPTLAALPRVGIFPERPSGYGELRREPGPEHLSTAEAVALALGALERDPARFEPLVRAFRTRRREAARVRPRQSGAARAIGPGAASLRTSGAGPGATGAARPRTYLATRTLSVAVFVTSPRVAVSVTFVRRATVSVVTANVARSAPAGTTTDAGAFAGGLVAARERHDHELRRRRGQHHRAGNLDRPPPMTDPRLSAT